MHPPVAPQHGSSHPHQHAQQYSQAAQQHYVKICELRPAPGNIVNTVFILLEKWPAARVSEGGAVVCTALVADSTAAVHMQLWGAEVDALQPGDIVRLTTGIFSFHKSNLVLRAGKKGALEKIGEFTMLFVEAPNMSRLQWAPDPANPKHWVPRGGMPAGGMAPHGR
ncbi:unnamed protein product [Closterium sp. NIES-54]